MDKAFSEVLSEAMAGMSQAELADRTGLRQATISRLLAGTRKPRYETIVALEKALPHLRTLRERSVA